MTISFGTQKAVSPVITGKTAFILLLPPLAPSLTPPHQSGLTILLSLSVVKRGKRCLTPHGWGHVSGRPSAVQTTFQIPIRTNKARFRRAFALTRSGGTRRTPGRCYWLRPAMTPPSTFQIAPVTQLASSERRKRITAATSAGVPIRPRGWKALNPWRVSWIFAGSMKAP